MHSSISTAPLHCWISIKYRISMLKEKRISYLKIFECQLHFLRISLYWDNFIHFSIGATRGPDGKMYITSPMNNKKMAGIASEYIGKAATSKDTLENKLAEGLV